MLFRSAVFVRVNRWAKKDVLQAAFLRLQQFGPTDHPLYLLMDRAYEGDETWAWAVFSLAMI